MSSDAAARRRRLPVRQCVVCRARLTKQDLVRVWRAADGTVAVDRSGKGPGRGAYVCDSSSCWRDRRLTTRVGRAIGARLTEDDMVRLNSYAAGLPGGGHLQQPATEAE